MKFNTHNDYKIKTVGTSIKAQIDISYYEIVSVFGEPHGSDGYKTDAEWGIEFEDGTIATIYNYKDGINYCGEEGTPTHQLRDWHIGGFSSNAVDLVKKALGF